MLNRHHVRLFAAVAEAGNVSRAAARLRLSQPALSQQLRQLESALGAPLFERLPRGIRLTAAGDLLAGYARQMQGIEDEAEQALASLQSLGRGKLRLGASMTIGTYLAPRLLAECRRRWPGLEIACDIANTETIQQALLERRFDLGLVEGPGRADASLASHVFRNDEMVVVAQPGLQPLAARVAALATYPWVLREPGSGTREVVLRALARQGVRVQPAWTFNNPEAVKQAVMAGCGIAMVPRLTVEAELAAGQLRLCRVRDLVTKRPLRAQWLRGRPTSPAMQAFMDVLAAPLPAVPKTRAGN